MRFLVDECTGPSVARWLRSQGHDVRSVFEENRGMADEAIVQQAFAEGRVLITNDKDFGEKVYRERFPHCGVVLLRLDDERVVAKTEALGRLLAQHSERLPNQFVVVTESKVRFSKAL